MSELEEFANDSTEDTEAQAEETEVEESTAEIEDSQEEESEEGSPAEPEEEPSEEPEKGSVPIAALLDEREKRQERDKRIKELESQLIKPEEKPTPDVIDDPEAYAKHIQESMQQTVHSTRIEMSQEVMRMMHDDYDAMETKFLEMATDNADLIAKMNASSLPAKFAYDTAKKAGELAELNNVDDYKAKIKAEVLAEIKAEQDAKDKDKQTKEDAITPSITSQRAEGGNKEVETVEDPLETTFDR